MLRDRMVQKTFEYEDIFQQVYSYEDASFRGTLVVMPAKNDRVKMILEVHERVQHSEDILVSKSEWITEWGRPARIAIHDSFLIFDVELTAQR